MINIYVHEYSIKNKHIVIILLMHEQNTVNNFTWLYIYLWYRRIVSITQFSLFA